MNTGLLFAGFVLGVAVATAIATVVYRRVVKVLAQMLDTREADIAFERRRTEALTEQILRMRRDGFIGSRAGHVAEKPDPELEAQARGEVLLRQRAGDAEFLTNAARDIRKRIPNLSAAEVDAEARRLLEETRMEQPSA